MTRNGKRIIIYHFPIPEGQTSEDLHGLVGEDANKYYILVNSSLTEEEQQAALGHELAHIFLGHLDDERSNDQEAEAEADREAGKYYQLYLSERIA